MKFCHLFELQWCFVVHEYHLRTKLMKGLPNRRGKKENSIIEEIYLYIYIYKTENKKPQYISPLTLLLFSFSKDKLNWKTINPVSWVPSQKQHSTYTGRRQQGLLLFFLIFYNNICLNSNIYEVNIHQQKAIWFLIICIW